MLNTLETCKQDIGSFSNMDCSGQDIGSVNMDSNDQNIRPLVAWTGVAKVVDYYY